MTWFTGTAFMLFMSVQFSSNIYSNSTWLGDSLPWVKSTCIRPQVNITWGPTQSCMYCLYITFRCLLWFEVWQLHSGIFFFFSPFETSRETLEIYLIERVTLLKNGLFLCPNGQAYIQHNELIKAVTLDLSGRLMSERVNWERLYLIMKERI